MSIATNPFQYDGYYLDPESGLYYLNARYYSPTLMQFISMDTYDLANRYAYCDGNPISGYDPSGHFNVGEFFMGMIPGYGLYEAYKDLKNGNYLAGVLGGLIGAYFTWDTVGLLGAGAIKLGQMAIGACSKDEFEGEVLTNNIKQFKFDLNEKLNLGHRDSIILSQNYPDPVKSNADFNNDVNDAMKTTANKFKYSSTALYSYKDNENIIEEWRMNLYSKNYQEFKEYIGKLGINNERFTTESNYGNCDRQAFYMCKILKDKGYNVNFHYRKVSNWNHFFGSIKFQNKNYIIDPWAGNFMETTKFTYKKGSDECCKNIVIVARKLLFS